MSYGLWAKLKAQSSKRKAQEGMTLVEVLLAVVILSVGIAGVLQAYAVAVTTLETGQDYVDAIQLLKAKMAEIEQKAIEEKGLSVGLSQGEFEEGLGDYQWEWEARPTPLESLHELKLVISSPPKNRQFSLITYVENKDYQQKD